VLATWRAGCTHRRKVCHGSSQPVPLAQSHAHQVRREAAASQFAPAAHGCRHPQAAAGLRLSIRSVSGPSTQQCIKSACARQDALDELLDGHGDLVRGTAEALQALPRDLDQVCRSLACPYSFFCMQQVWHARGMRACALMACAHAHSLTQTVQAVQRDPGKTENTRRVEALVQAALLLREALAALPALATALAPAQSELLKAVRLLRVQPVVATTCNSSRCSGDIIGLSGEQRRCGQTLATPALQSCRRA